MKITLATDRNSEAINQIANSYKSELGFLRKVSIIDSIRKGEINIILEESMVTGFIRYHLRKDGIHTIYDLAVHRDYRMKGIGTALLNSISTPKRLKVTIDNEMAIRFYRKHLFEIERQAGRKRELLLFGDKEYYRIYLLQRE